MARQLKERYSVPHYFTDVGELLEKAKPDVVHITTPPQSHFPLGQQCLNAGCHVYIEKPFTVNYAETEELIRLAERKNLRITVGHNQQFSHAARRMRELVAADYLGGPAVHVESYDGYELDGQYAKALLSDQGHWVRQLPGALVHNIMSHGISKIAEFIRHDSVSVVARGFASPILRSVGETAIVDEVRGIISDGATTAYYTFSTQMRPVLEELRVYGPKNALIVDTNQQTVIRLKGAPHKSFLEQFVPPWTYCAQYLKNFSGNVRKFVKADFHPDQGKRFLIRSFYESIANGTPVPIPYREILMTSRIIDEILVQLTPAARAESREREMAAVSQGR
jgi:predicted dehydrogenase